MNFFIEELKTIANKHPDACVLIYRSDYPGETVIFDTWGVEAVAKEEVAVCNRRLAPKPEGVEALFQPNGSFDYMSVKTAISWLTDGETPPWNVANLGEYGAYAYIMQAPRHVISAFKARIDNR